MIALPFSTWDGKGMLRRFDPEPDNLPYVLNGPIYLNLFEKLPMSLEVDILHNTSMLQDLLQICKIY